MIGTGKLISTARNLIGYHRRSVLVGALHRFASFVESAYANEGASFEVNGERGLPGKLSPSDFKIAFDVGANFGDWLTTGDTYCDRHDIDCLDFLKVDVEGAEHRDINGFSRRISAHKVHCLQFEYGAFSTQTKCLPADTYSMLLENYWIGKIFPRYVGFQEYHWSMEDLRISNYCCVSKLRPDLRTALAN